MIVKITSSFLIHQSLSLFTWTILLPMLINHSSVWGSGFTLEKASPSNSQYGMSSKKEEAAGLTNVIQKSVLEGGSVKFKCSRDIQNEDNISWTFTRCDGEKCNQLDKRLSSETLCGGNSESFQPCRMTLKLDKLTRKQSGIYRCYQIKSPPAPGYIHRTMLISAYQLTVAGAVRDEIVVFEGPNDLNLVIGNNGEFQCRVKTSQPVLLKWFKELPVPPVKLLPNHVQYHNKTYLRIDTGVTDEEHGTEKWSRLTINASTDKDSGIYVCGLISISGIQLRKAKLNVFTPLSANVTIENDEQTWQYLYERTSWELAISAGAVACVVLVTAGWAAVCCCIAAGGGNKKRSRRRRITQENRQTSAAIHPAPLSLPHITVTSDTSEYEQV